MPEWLDGWKVAQFLFDNWMNIASFAGFVVVFFQSKDQKEKAAAKAAVFAMAVDAVKKAAEQTLENKQKRDWAINTVLEVMPENFRKHVNPEDVSILVERAWRDVVKPQL
jgi:FKBP-type peptidyl-prolyl cis-trans isomerase (trigger factor)